MTSAADLLGLQEIDLSLDTRRALMADVNSRLGETEALIEARNGVAAAEANHADVRRRQRELDAQLEDLDAKLRSFENKLYGGTVRNPKELTDLQHEVDILRRRRSGLDDAGLAIMDEVEKADEDLDEARKRLAATEAEWQADQEALLAQRERVEREVAQLQDERLRRVSMMDTRSISTYEMLRQARQGRAVARIERGSCQGCRLSLPTHIVQRTRSSQELVQCPSCERILAGG